MYFSLLSRVHFVISISPARGVGKFIQCRLLRHRRRQSELVPPRRYCRRRPRRLCGRVRTSFVRASARERDIRLCARTDVFGLCARALARRLLLPRGRRRGPAHDRNRPPPRHRAHVPQPAPPPTGAPRARLVPPACHGLLESAPSPVMASQARTAPRPPPQAPALPTPLCSAEAAAAVTP